MLLRLSAWCLVFESGWVLWNACWSSETPAGPIWLMDLCIVFLVARTLVARVTLARAAFLCGCMVVWVPTLFIMSAVGRTCATHARSVATLAEGLGVMKALLLLAVGLSQWWGGRSAPKPPERRELTSAHR